MIRVAKLLKRDSKDAIILASAIDTGNGYRLHPALTTGVHFNG